MSATISFEVEDGVPLSTARPDGFWCALVTAIDQDCTNPYDYGAIQLQEKDRDALLRLKSAGWHEVDALIDAMKFNRTVWVHRDP